MHATCHPCWTHDRDLCGYSLLCHDYVSCCQFCEHAKRTTIVTASMVGVWPCKLHKHRLVMRPDLCQCILLWHGLERRRSDSGHCACAWAVDDCGSRRLHDDISCSTWGSVGGCERIGRSVGRNVRRGCVQLHQQAILRDRAEPCGARAHEIHLRVLELVGVLQIL